MRVETGPEANSKDTEWKWAIAVFIVTAMAFQYFLANRFILSFDEGIYLSRAERVLRGQAPYRDFFVLTGPGSFWIQAVILGLLGRTLAHARLALVTDLSILAAVVYWLSARLSRPKMALVVTLFFVAYETRPLFRLYVNHRWDSSALSLLAVALAFAGTEEPTFTSWLAAGFLAAAAAWITPSMFVLIATLAFWLFWNHTLRGKFAAYLLGVALCSAGAGGVLLAQGSLGPMFHDLLWTAAHYGAANRVPYGYGAIPPEGITTVFAGARGSAIFARATGLFSVLLPPLLPWAAYAVWLVHRRRRHSGHPQEKLISLLVISSFALLVSAYPRWSADQLLFVAPIFYALAGYLTDRLTTSKALRIAGAVCVLLLAAASLTYSALNVLSEPVVETRVGRVRATPVDQQFIDFADRVIPTGDSLFVYPYMPLVYFLTGARNPTRYSFLQPGMMDAADYNRALADLQARPSQWIFYFPITRGTYQSVWPNADPEGLATTPLDRYLHDNYGVAAELKHPAGEFFILKRNGS